MNVAVGKDTFDSDPYNAKVASGLRNYLEGFNPASDCFMKNVPDEPFCDEECGERLLHNSVSHYTLAYNTNACLFPDSSSYPTLSQEYRHKYRHNQRPWPLTCCTFGLIGKLFYQAHNFNQRMYTVKRDIKPMYQILHNNG